MPPPFSIRLPAEAITRLAGQARAHGIAPRTLARRYIDEGLRMDAHPRIRFADGELGRVATVGSWPVWRVISVLLEERRDPAAAAATLGISTAAVDVAVTYFGHFKDEIDALMRAADRAAADAELDGWGVAAAALWSPPRVPPPDDSWRR